MTDQQITFVTGNPNKLRELQSIFPAELSLTYRDISIDEIQGDADSRKIVGHKLDCAYEAIKAPVLVEDVSAGIESLGWLPGSFIKYFEEKLGGSALYVMSKLPENDRIQAICTMGYKDSQQTIIVDGTLSGRLSTPRGKEGFGFDPVFIPDGYDQTLAELGPEVKNKISHRHKATTAMIAALKQAGIW